MDTFWILNADETRGRIFSSDEFLGKLKLEERHDLVHPEARLSERELATRTRGRINSTQFAKGHGLNQQGALKEHQAEVFAKEIADNLIASDLDHQFKHLVLIAPPKFLGLLRQNLNTNLLDKVYLEINKELSHLTMHELSKYIEKHIAT